MIEWNKVIYDDCLSQKNGLHTLHDKSIDLCLTDPLYNVGYKGKKNIATIKYSDKTSYVEYKKFCERFFIELKRICRGILIHCGFPNLNMWIADIEKPRDIIYHYAYDLNTQSSMSHLCRLTPILCYGEFNRRFRENPIKIKSSADRKYSSYKRGKSLHPCPVNELLWMKILKRLEPSSVIDPFIGSGTTAFCCKQLGIKWTGYEINLEYKPIIENRLKQTSLF